MYVTDDTWGREKNGKRGKKMKEGKKKGRIK
jgi:hypothetical protein